MAAPVLNLTYSPTNPAPGATITATYSWTNAPADRVFTPNGGASLDGVSYPAVSGSLTLTHTYAYQAPTATGLTFAATSDPKVWTAVAPAS